MGSRASQRARYTARPTAARTLASLVVLALATPSLADEHDGGVVLDAPRIVKLSTGHYDFNPAAFKSVDDELKRLQQLERVHKGEPSWAQPVLVGAVVGVVMGAALGVGATLLWERLVPAANAPSR